MNKSAIHLRQTDTRSNMNSATLTRRLLLSAATSILMCGCVTTGSPNASNTSNPIVDVLKATNRGLESVKSGLLDIAKTPFDGLFENSSGTDWPRVSMTITKLPPDAYKNRLVFHAENNGKIPAGYCIWASAIVWKSAGEKFEIPESKFCGINAITNGENAYDLSNYLIWGAMKHPGKHTGKNRTTGPLPPELPLPPGNKYTDFYPGMGGEMLSYLIIKMGYDITVDPMNDRRLWIVSLPGPGQK